MKKLHWHVDVDGTEAHSTDQIGYFTIWVSGFLSGAGFSEDRRAFLLVEISTKTTLDFVYSFELPDGRFVEFSQVMREPRPW